MTTSEIMQPPHAYGEQTVRRLLNNGDTRLAWAQGLPVEMLDTPISQLPPTIQNRIAYSLAYGGQQGAPHTLGDLAAKLGYKLRPDVPPSTPVELMEVIDPNTGAVDPLRVQQRYGHQLDIPLTGAQVTGRQDVLSRRFDMDYQAELNKLYALAKSVQEGKSGAPIHAANARLQAALDDANARFQKRANALAKEGVPVEFSGFPVTPYGQGDLEGFTRGQREKEFQANYTRTLTGLRSQIDAALNRRNTGLAAKLVGDYNAIIQRANAIAQAQGFTLVFEPWSAGGGGLAAQTPPINVNVNLPQMGPVSGTVEAADGKTYQTGWELNPRTGLSVPYYVVGGQKVDQSHFDRETGGQAKPKAWNQKAYSDALAALDRTLGTVLPLSDGSIPAYEQPRVDAAKQVFIDKATALGMDPERARLEADERVKGQIKPLKPRQQQKPPSPPPPATSKPGAGHQIRMADLQRMAREQKKPVAQLVQEAKEQGYSIVP